MRRLAWGPGLAIAFALALGGCSTDAQSNETGLCTSVCRCAGGLPSQQRECVAECVGEGVFRQASNACQQCVLSNTSTLGCSITELAQDCFINGPCMITGEDDDPQPGLPDAGTADAL